MDERDIFPILQNLNQLKNSGEKQSEIGKYQEFLNSFLKMNEFLDEKYSNIPLKQNNWQDSDISHLNERIMHFWNSFDRIESQFINIFLDKKNIENYKRIFTLNHSGGYIIDDLRTLNNTQSNTINNISQNFIHATVYLSIYESFSLFLRPFLAELWKTKLNQNKMYFNRTSGDIYRIYLRTFFHFGKYDDVFDYKLRNNIAHHSIIFYPKKIERIEFLKDNIQLSSLSDSINFQGKFETIYAVVLKFILNFEIYSLKLILKNIEQNKGELIPFWENYFEEYYKSWVDFEKIPN